jgi:hypothetical protein
VLLANETTQGFDGYSYVDSLTLITSTIREDSLRSDSLSHNLIGAINDPVFGLSKATTFIQFKLPQINNVISSQNLDSVVLFAQFTSKTAYYGDLNTNMEISLHELTEKMGSAVTHSNQAYAYDPVPVGTFNGKFNLNDSMNIRDLKNNIKGAPGMSIKLSNAMAQKLFNANASQLSSQDNFTDFFKGLAFVTSSTPNSGSGVIAAINMTASFSLIRIYYNDSMQSDFKVIDNAERFTKYDISNQSSLIANQKSIGTQFNFDTTYLQSMTGAKTKIEIPYLYTLIPKNGKRISIGKAEIILHPLAGTYNSPFGLPSRLLMLQPNKETNLNESITDLLEPYYGGSYNSAKNEYRFNITRHLQGLINDYVNTKTDNNRGLYLLIPSDNPIAPSRMYVDTRKKLQDAGIEIRIVYTEL